ARAARARGAGLGAASATLPARGPSGRVCMRGLHGTGSSTADSGRRRPSSFCHKRMTLSIYLSEITRVWIWGTTPLTLGKYRITQNDPVVGAEADRSDQQLRSPVRRHAVVVVIHVEVVVAVLPGGAAARTDVATLGRDELVAARLHHRLARAVGVGAR